MAKQEELINQVYSRQMDDVLKRLHYEVGLLKEWFKRDFPESRLEVLVEANNITKDFTIKTKVLMGEEMVNNRGFFSNVLALKEKDLINPSFMGAFFDAFGNEYRKQISTAINTHYRNEKAKEEGSWFIS